MANTPDALRTSHTDGYRILAEVTDRKNGGSLLQLQLCYLHGDTIRSKAVLWEKQCDAVSVVDELPGFRRLEKLLAAFTRFFNEGGSTDVVVMLEDIARNHITARVGAELVASESQETHARTFLLPDGMYLHVVEDQFSEVLTAAEMQEAARREANLEENDDLGLYL